MRRFLTTIILVITLPLGELHSYWAKDTRVQNWIIAVRRPMLISWNIKFVEMEVVVIMYFLAWTFYIKNRINKTTVEAFLILSIVDILFYFYNYKLGGFGSAYLWFALIWLVIYYRHSIKRIWT